MARKRTMIPIPPSHCVNWRQRITDWSTPSMSVSTLAPVVVKPDIASKYAFTGLESWSSPDRR
jgi:hypothetical protein